MQAIMPIVSVTGDNDARIMARSGDLCGFTKSRMVWRFGFLPGSDSSKAFGVESPGFLWALCNARGKVLATWEGAFYDLPARFKSILATRG